MPALVERGWDPVSNNGVALDVIAKLPKRVS